MSISPKSKHSRTANIVSASVRPEDADRPGGRRAGQSRNQFILETACQEARSVLLDQTHFNLDEDAFRRFTELLDAPPNPNPGLECLLSRKAPWEEQAATSPEAPGPGRSGGLRGGEAGDDAAVGYGVRAEGGFAAFALDQRQRRSHVFHADVKRDVLPRRAHGAPPPGLEPVSTSE